ncbi:MAG TPA: MmcQ/YjbR family DNA-binding protein [Candidatus Acidoferrales bacterium]|nr:MmcQ/YjbR family DNA-binding protein [Candidatus Acidoferrales bacterium]
MPVSPDTFRQIALSFEGAEERAHQAHPDFRVKGKIFATLGYPDAAWGMVKLTPDEQRAYMKIEPGAFEPASGAWGAKGSTLVKLSKVKKATLHDALESAWSLPSSRE